MVDEAMTARSGHPIVQLDEVVHQRVRLGILAVLSEAEKVDFTHLRDVLGVTDGNLSRHLSVLHEAGYVETHKTFEGRRPRTWIVATRRGRRALADQRAALGDLMAQVGEP